MLGLEKNWVEKVKQHKAYEFWSGILSVHPKQIIGQPYAYRGRKMETPSGVYLTNWLTFIYVHPDGMACRLSTKSTEMITKSLFIKEDTNIVMDDQKEFCTLIGRLASTDEDGHVTLVNTNTVFFPMLDNLLQGIFPEPNSYSPPTEVKVTSPFKKEETFNMKPTKKDSLIPPQAKRLLYGEAFIKARVIAMKKNRKGKAAIAEKLSITLEDVENYLK